MQKLFQNYYNSAKANSITKIVIYDLVLSAFDPRGETAMATSSILNNTFKGYAIIAGRESNNKIITFSVFNYEYPTSTLMLYRSSFRNTSSSGVGAFVDLSEDTLSERRTYTIKYSIIRK